MRHSRTPTFERGAAAAREEPSSRPVKRATDGLCAELQAAWQVLTRLGEELSQASSSLRETTKFWERCTLLTPGTKRSQGNCLLPR